MFEEQCPVYCKWRSAAGSTWRDYVEHEFVRRLGDGSLPEAVFLAYLIQDYLFLLQYSRAWSLAVVKSDSVLQMRTAASTVNALINEEIQLHIEICAAQGISEQQLIEAKEASENIAYTRFVMDKGLSGDLLDLLAALAPCALGYYEIGMSQADCRDTLPVYRQWIDTYCAPEYLDVCLGIGQLIEEVSAEKLGTQPESSPRWSSLCQTFRTATALEANFWQMGFRLAQN